MAFTPFYGHANAARDPDWVMFARCIYALGCKLPNDAATHMVRRTQDSVRGTEDLVGRIYSKLKISFAYSEEMRAKQNVIQHDVVEPDSAQAGIRRAASPTQKEIRGRTLVFKGRFSKEWVARALPPKTSKKGRGMGPESLEEVEHAVKQALGAGTVASPDGGQAFHTAASKAGKRCLKGVKHGKNIFTPVAKLLKNSLDKATVTTLRKMTKGEAAVCERICPVFHPPRG